MTYIKRIIRRLRYRLNAFLYRFESKRHEDYIYENSDDDKSDGQKQERDRMNKHFNGKSYVKDGIESDF